MILLLRVRGHEWGLGGWGKQRFGRAAYILQTVENIIQSMSLPHLVNTYWSKSKVSLKTSLGEEGVVERSKPGEGQVAEE